MKNSLTAKQREHITSLTKLMAPSFPRAMAVEVIYATLPPAWIHGHERFEHDARRLIEDITLEMEHEPTRRTTGSVLDQDVPSGSPT